jgi:Flp pilus assembly protein TadG
MKMRTIRPLRNFSARLVAFLRDRRGVAAIEFAFIAPLLLLLYFGTVDTANWYMAHRRLVLAGSTVADLTTQSATSVKSTDIKSFWDATSRIVDPA